MSSKRRERELARQRHLRRQQHLAAQRARARRRNLLIVGAVVGALLLGGGVFGLVQWLGGEDEAVLTTPPVTPSASASATPSPAAAGACTYTDAPGETGGARVEKPKAADLERSKVYLATITTNRGDLKVRMPSKDAPCTVNSFRSLAAQNFFDDTECHRLTTAPGSLFVLQCGDPTGTGAGGPGYQFPDENLEGATYPAGTVAMANSGPGTNGSQFFVVYKDSQLAPNYTPFGTVTKGLAVVERVGEAGSEPAGDGKPKQRVVIEDFRIRAAA